MNFIKHFYNKNMKYDLLNKFYYINTKKLPKIKKIVITLNCKTTKMASLAFSSLALELVTSQKSQFIISKKANLLLKIRKGNPIGCKVTLKKNKMFKFLENTCCNIIPQLKVLNKMSIESKINKNYFKYNIANLFIFNELEKNYYLFNEIGNLNITIVTDSTKIKETKFLFHSFQLNYSICKYNSNGRV